MKIQTRRNKHLPAIITACIVLLLLVTGAILYVLAIRNHSPAQTPSAGGYNPSTSTPTPDVPKANSTENQSTNSVTATKGQSSTPAAPPSATVTPTTPFGQFVSNSKPSLSDPAQDAESSVCSTTAGVACQITFTSGSTIKSLPSQTTDTNGNTSWGWSINKLGLTAGTWKISVVATNGNHIATAIENLVIRQ
jgi:hypothetical protein